MNDPTYKILQPLLRAAHEFSVAVYGQSVVYLTGGKNAASNTKLVAVYDVVRDEWSEGPRLNHGRWSHTSTCLGSRVYVFGDYTEK